MGVAEKVSHGPDRTYVGVCGCNRHGARCPVRVSLGAFNFNCQII